jgi:hypothetical protein
MGLWAMHNQSWQTAVELDEYGGRAFVRVIENGVVRIRAFKLQSEAVAFAQSERERLGVSQIVTPYRPITAGSSTLPIGPAGRFGEAAQRIRDEVVARGRE